MDYQSEIKQAARQIGTGILGLIIIFFLNAPAFAEEAPPEPEPIYPVTLIARDGHRWFYHMSNDGVRIYPHKLKGIKDDRGHIDRVMQTPLFKVGNAVFTVGTWALQWVVVAK